MLFVLSLLLTPTLASAKVAATSRIMYMLFMLSLFLSPTLTSARAVATSTSPYPPWETGQQYLDIASSLTVTAYEEENCEGNNFVELEQVRYGQNWSVQFNSYKPSRPLNPPERMDIYNALPTGGALNPAYNGDVATCAHFFDSPSGNDVGTGYHNTEQAMGCIRIWMPRKPYPPQAIG